MIKNKNFALIGASGYIAPRHISAINDVGGKIICATDVNDSVGILDRHTQDVAFYTDFERFQEKMRENAKQGKKDKAREKKQQADESDLYQILKHIIFLFIQKIECI